VGKLTLTLKENHNKLFQKQNKTKQNKTKTKQTKQNNNNNNNNNTNLNNCQIIASSLRTKNGRRRTQISFEKSSIFKIEDSQR
jgi:hypothetical protein